MAPIIGTFSSTYIPAVVVIPTTWNPADKSTDITLSNGNLTMTQVGSDGAYQSVRTVASATSGKKYWEINVDLITDTNPEVGMGVAAAALSSFLGNGTDSIGWLPNGQVYFNSSLVTTIATWTTGSLLSVAADLGGGLIWFRVGSGNWNNSGAANPATGAGGLDISTMTSGGKFPIGQLLHTATAYTANFGATSYAQTAPSGYGNW